MVMAVMSRAKLKLVKACALEQGQETPRPAHAKIKRPSSLATLSVSSGGGAIKTPRLHAQVFDSKWRRPRHVYRVAKDEQAKLEELFQVTEELNMQACRRYLIVCKEPEKVAPLLRQRGITGITPVRVTPDSSAGEPMQVGVWITNKVVDGGQMFAVILFYDVPSDLDEYRRMVNMASAWNSHPLVISFIRQGEEDDGVVQSMEQAGINSRYLPLDFSYFGYGFPVPIELD